MLTCALSPSGRVTVHVEEGAPGPRSAGRIVDAFAQGSGFGLLHLGAAELHTPLDPALSYWRTFARHFVSAACAALDPTDAGAVVRPEVDPSALALQVIAAPPMPGAETLTVDRLETLWDEMSAALTTRAADHAGGVRAYLEACDASWHVAGRVCLHLAENKRDPKHPFAFIATYARRLAGRAQLQYVPLSRALQEYAGTGNKAQLLTLLTPLQRAAEDSALVRDLVDSGDVYHALAWTAAQAYAFLCEVPRFEEAGLVVRLPDWWSAKRRPRPQTSVTIGANAGSTLGMSALVEFDVQLTLGGEALTPDEVALALRSSAGLVFIKGQWVEVDSERLTEVLNHWRRVQAQADDGEISFAEGMRLLAGGGRDPAGGDLDDDRPQWSTVVAGGWLQEQLEALRAPAVMAAIEAGAGLDAQLRPYQQVGVQWLWTLRGLGLGGCLADDMGLGKTIQVIALMSLLREAPEAGVDLLVVPASLVGNWASELARFAPQLRVFIAHASHLPARALKALDPAEVQAYDVVITTYGTATRLPWMKTFGWRCAVLDEAQAIKNPGAKQTRAIKQIQAGWRLALTGTPVENRLGDLWSVFDYLNPGLLGTAKQFSALSKRMAQAPVDGYAPLRRLVSPYILRRMKTDRSVVADLPDKTEVTAHCLLSKTQAALYQQSVDALQAAIDGTEGIKRRGLVLAYLTRLKQICNHPSQWLADGEYDPAQSGKFDRLADLCEPIAARQEKVLVFTQYRTLTDPLQAFLSTCFGRPGLVLHGGTPVKKRAALVAQFQTDEAVPFMVLSLKAGGTGLNLTAANHVIHFDRWWNPAVENQATDRAFRIGQKRNVLVQKFVCQGTVEERIDALIAGKQALADQVLSGGGETQLTELSDAELMAMVRLDLESAVSQ